MTGKGLNFADTIDHRLDSNFALSEDDKMKAANYTLYCQLSRSMRVRHTLS